MWYWLDGLINSRLIDPGFLSIIWVAGFLLGFLIGSALLAKTRIRYGWILIVLIGALCTKGLIALFESLQFYTWEMMTASPYFLGFSVIFLGLLAALVYLLVKKYNRGNRRYYRR